jgi:ATP-dependent Zn protease
MFTDKFDAVGKVRTGRSNCQDKGNTLNALLTEIDG